LAEASVRVVDGRVVLAGCGSERACRGLDPDDIDPLEVAYRVVKGVLEVEGRGSGWGPALSLLEAVGVPVDLFIVFYDLRRRGRRVRRGVRPGTLLVDLGGRRFEILVLSLGVKRRLGGLLEWSRLAAADDREPVIAVVDGYGSVTYYTARTSDSIR